MGEPLMQSDALLIVDVQRDFCQGGSLAVQDADSVVPVLNQWIERAVNVKVAVFASRDWHPEGHTSFQAQGGPWPRHCVQDTEGASFHAELRLPEDVNLITKGNRVDKDAYSAFDGTDLAARLREAGVRKLWIGGLAQDICVKATVLDARREGFDTHVIVAATKPVTAEGGDRALQEMKEAGASLEL